MRGLSSDIFHRLALEVHSRQGSFARRGCGLQRSEKIFLPLQFSSNQHKDKLDAISDLMPRSSLPRKRGPAARASRLSFLDEINEADLQTYTPTQLRQVLSQRSHVRNHFSFVQSCKAFPFHSSLEQHLTTVGTRSG